MNNQKLSTQYFINNNTLQLSKSLIGKYIYTNINNSIVCGMIVETEAYIGKNDKASHAYNNKRTKRTEVMFLNGGICYIYLCYGIHFLFNIVTGIKNYPNAILIRAIEPKKGVDTMIERRGSKNSQYNLTNGPGKLSQALGITKSLNGESLAGNNIWIQDESIEINQKEILSSPRIGVDYAGNDANLLYRFYLKSNKWVSKNG